MILGCPGTGKSTTLIRRLGQKPINVELPDEERITIDTAASVVLHASSWKVASDFYDQFTKREPQGICQANQQEKRWIALTILKATEVGHVDRGAVR